VGNTIMGRMVVTACLPWLALASLLLNSNLSPPQQNNRIRIKPSVLTNNQKYAVLVTVRLRSEDATVQVCLDGEPHLDWSGKATLTY